MPADEHLRRSFDALADRLREDISRQLDAISGELAASIDEDHERRSAASMAAAEEAREQALALAAEEREEAIARAEQAARADAEREAGERLSSSIALAEANAREDGRREGFAAGLEQGLEQGLEEGRGEGRAQGLEQGREDARLEAEAEARARTAEAVELGTEMSGPSAGERLVEALRTMDGARSLSEILDTLARSAAREAARVGVLLVRGNHFRAWRLTGFGAEFDERADFEMPIADAGIMGDVVRTAAPVSGLNAVHASAPVFAALPRGQATLALPVPMSGRVVAVLYADQGDHEPGADAAWPFTLEVMTRHAARCLESITAVRAAQVLTERPEARPAAPASPPADVGRAQRQAAGSDPVEEEHSARRYARLLISEIKMYHEPAVIEGRREGNLAERLAGEIARARVLYEQRVPIAIRQARDYFHEELVRTLADGDGSLFARTPAQE